MLSGRVDFVDGERLRMVPGIVTEGKSGGAVLGPLLPQERLAGPERPEVPPGARGLVHGPPGRRQAGYGVGTVPVPPSASRRSLVAAEELDHRPRRGDRCDVPASQKETMSKKSHDDKKRRAERMRQRVRPAQRRPPVSPAFEMAKRIVATLSPGMGEEDIAAVLTMANAIAAVRKTDPAKELLNLYRLRELPVEERAQHADDEFLTMLAGFFAYPSIRLDDVGKALDSTDEPIGSAFDETAGRYVLRPQRPQDDGESRLFPKQVDQAQIEALPDDLQAMMVLVQFSPGILREDANAAMEVALELAAKRGEPIGVVVTHLLRYRDMKPEERAAHIDPDVEQRLAGFFAFPGISMTEFVRLQAITGAPPIAERDEATGRWTLRPATSAER